MACLSALDGLADPRHSFGKGFELFGRQAHAVLNNNSPTLLGVLLAFGFAMGFSPKLRKFLSKLL